MAAKLIIQFRHFCAEHESRYICCLRRHKLLTVVQFCKGEVFQHCRTNKIHFFIQCIMN
jgi:hypothetical protein